MQLKLARHVVVTCCHGYLVGSPLTGPAILFSISSTYNIYESVSLFNFTTNAERTSEFIGFQNRIITIDCLCKIVINFKRIGVSEQFLYHILHIIQKFFA